MEDCCAVCAEPLEWAGYGPCGHREVCFTCIARLRFVLNDKRCCICKQDCPCVYITKALGDYTRVVTDWKSLLNHNYSPADGTLWYDNAVEAYFDDEEPFKIIKAMCRLYCSICEKASEEETVGKGIVKKGYIFKNIDTLRRHQFNSHKVFMCELCLEGRKVFICQQKLYSKPQLDQHSSKGDSEVDGNEEERGGFAGHPKCAFCRKRFYGDNELYQHMSQEHYTCHICQRARPGHYEYYRNYDDLEAHFRQEHVLCEHSECLAKKFVVFPSETELKRHNATTHGGHMSRSQRNAALQIPVSFHYRRPGQDSSDDNGYMSRRSGRGRSAHPYSSTGRTDQLDAAARASLESANLEEAVQESLAFASSIDRSGTSDSQGAVERPTSVDPDVGTCLVQTDSDNEPSRYLAAVWGAGPSALGDAAFPPLPGISKNARRRAKLKNQAPSTMATRLGGGSGRGGIRVLNAADYRPPSSPSQTLHSSAYGVETSQGEHQSTTAARRESVDPLSIMNDEVGQSQIGQSHSWSTVSASGPPAVASQGATGGGSSSIGNGVSTKTMVVAGENLASQFSRLSMDDIRAANKALVERIRALLAGNEQHFADFKDVSSSFRKGEMSSKEYYGHVARLGLSTVVPELARLCPDSRKAKELTDAHTAQLTSNVVDPKNLIPGLAGAFSSSSQLSVAQTKQPALSVLQSSGMDSSANTAVSMGTSRRGNPDNGEVEVLSTNGYRRTKGKSKVIESSSSQSNAPQHGMPSTEGTLLNELVAARDRSPQVLVRAVTPVTQDPQQPQGSLERSLAKMEGGWACGLCTLVNTSDNFQCAACGTGKPGEEPKGSVDSSGGIEKKKKKIPKFQRGRLGDGSAASLLDSTPPNPWLHSQQIENEPRSSGRSFSQGAWNNGGGQRLVSMVQRGGHH